MKHKENLKTGWTARHSFMVYFFATAFLKYFDCMKPFFYFECTEVCQRFLNDKMIRPNRVSFSFRNFYHTSLVLTRIFSFVFINTTLMLNDKIVRLSFDMHYLNFQLFVTNWNYCPAFTDGKFSGALMLEHHTRQCGAEIT